ncbi:MAG: DUF917 domain-containing protein [Candidatus Bathyarchaeota archaeon]|nr:DUF917 domain-containing protein [Candidatus Bathyarchaeota archaeon]MDH5754917.1 DUF917 domain-containing protein [Candidatus Bathyarchaeota archaeon]
MRILRPQDLLDLVDGAAIFSAGGGGDPEIGYKLVDKLVSDGYIVKLVSPSEVPDDAKVVNFACVGATTTVEYDADAAVKTLRILEEYAGFSAYATIPVELGGFNTLAAVDVAARCAIPVVDADGAGRSVPEVHLKVYTIDDILLTPMVVADLHAKNIVIAKETVNSKAAERIARVLATEWNHSAYTARRILTGAQAKTSPIQLSLSKSMNIGKMLRKSVDPIKAVLKETDSFKLFEGIVGHVKRETEAGFTFVNIKLRGTHEYAGSMFEFKAKNEVLVAYRDGKLAAIAPDIITPVHPETSRCITAEKIEKGDKLAVLGLPAPQKWRTSKGLELWKDVLQRSNILEECVPIEQIASV